MTARPIICFDVGGTLIKDPFEAILFDDAMLVGLTRLFTSFGFPQRVQNFRDAWRHANRTIDFSFASHFVQEEVWIERALAATGVAPDIAPIIGPHILALYREALPKSVGSQEQLPVLRETFEWLRKHGIAVHLASNDRAFATPALARWAGVESVIDRAFVSEALSSTYPRAEKPNEEFFQALLKELRVPDPLRHTVIYVGDTERNDIIPALQAGLTAVRYFDATANNANVWLDHAQTTQAKYHYCDPRQLKNVLRAVLAEAVS